ncbi:MAG TPA: ParB/RepB/Spo0J family partition protein [Gammaproteobacteria bacterium]|nr:ParB/RepB/Spo0J family partition protein [Gammaproteobacteria bacterium]
MARKKPGLGRGLDALLSSASRNNESRQQDNQLKDIPVDQIQRGPYQPRRHFEQDRLEELAESIKAQGIVQPIVVRPVGPGYELIAGERRWRAAQIAGLEQIPAVVKEIPDQAVAAMSLIENIQREDLNPLEESEALHRLIEEFGLTHQGAADAVGRSRTAVTNLLRLLDLEPAVRQLLDERRLEMGHARALLVLDGVDQEAAARHVVARQLSVRETERYVKSLKNGGNPKPHRKRSPDIISLEKELSDNLGASVRIDYNSRGKGKLVIAYNSLDELDGILEHIKR